MYVVSILRQYLLTIYDFVMCSKLGIHIVNCIVVLSLFRSLFCVSFFFFKQKTAYEMRISDWSSDVCSSDLLPATQQPEPDPAMQEELSQLVTGLGNKLRASNTSPDDDATGI